jgi:hypothetical protein
MAEYAPAGILRDSLARACRREGVEIDMIKFSGPVFGSVDNRVMSLQGIDDCPETLRAPR